MFHTLLASLSLVRRRKSAQASTHSSFPWFPSRHVSVVRHGHIADLLEAKVVEGFADVGVCSRADANMLVVALTGDDTFFDLVSRTENQTIIKIMFLGYSQKWIPGFQINIPLRVRIASISRQLTMGRSLPDLSGRSGQPAAASSI